MLVIFENSTTKNICTSIMSSELIPAQDRNDVKGLIFVKTLDRFKKPKEHSTMEIIPISQQTKLASFSSNLPRAIFCNPICDAIISPRMKIARLITNTHGVFRLSSFSFILYFFIKYATTIIQVKEGVR